MNPAARQGARRKASQARTRATVERAWVTEDTALLLAERCALLGGDAEFARILAMPFTWSRRPERARP